MSWEDKDIDELFRNADAGARFEYSNDFFNDIEAELPIQRRKKLFPYWLPAFVILIGITGLLIWLPESESNIASTSMDLDLTGGQSKTNLSSKKNGAKTNGLVSDDMLTAYDSQNAEVSDIDVSNVAVLKGYKKSNQFVAKGDVILSENEKNVIETVANSDDFKVDELHTMEASYFNLSSPTIITHGKYTKRLTRNNLFAQGGFGLGQSYIGSTENGSAISQNINLSFGYQRRVGTQLALEASVGASQEFFDNLYIKERSTVYGFTSNTVDNHYQFKSISRLNLSMGIVYAVNKHQFGMNISASKPLLATIKYSETIDGAVMEEGKGFTDVSYFRSIDLQPGFTYNYSLSPQWKIGASVNARIGNPIISDRILGDKIALPLSGQVQLRYNITLRK